MNSIAVTVVDPPPRGVDIVRRYVPPSNSSNLPNFVGAVARPRSVDDLHFMHDAWSGVVNTAFVVVLLVVYLSNANLPTSRAVFPAAGTLALAPLTGVVRCCEHARPGVHPA